MDRALNRIREQLRAKKLKNFDVEIQRDELMGDRISLFVIYSNNIKAPLFNSTEPEEVEEYIRTRL